MAEASTAYPTQLLEQLTRSLQVCCLPSRACLTPIHTARMWHVL